MSGAGVIEDADWQICWDFQKDVAFSNRVGWRSPSWSAFPMHHASHASMLDFSDPNARQWPQMWGEDQTAWTVTSPGIPLMGIAKTDWTGTHWRKPLPGFDQEHNVESGSSEEVLWVDNGSLMWPQVEMWPWGQSSVQNSWQTEENFGKGCSWQSRQGQWWQGAVTNSGPESAVSRHHDRKTYPASQWKPKVRNGKEAGIEAIPQIATALAEASVLVRADFDFRVCRHLSMLHEHGGDEKVDQAIGMIIAYTQRKTRQSVKNWPAYLLTLLRKIEPDASSKKRNSSKDLEGDEEIMAPDVPTANTGVENHSDHDCKNLAGRSDQDHAATKTHPSERFVDAHVMSEDNEVPVESNGEGVPIRDVPTKGLGPLDIMQASFPTSHRAQHSIFQGIQDSLCGVPSDLRCPFTLQPLNLQAQIVSQAALSISAVSATGNNEIVQRYVKGLANSLKLNDHPQIISALEATAHSELAGLPEDMTVMEAAAAATTIAHTHSSAATVAFTVVQEISLEIVAEVLKNPQFSLAQKCI